MKPNKTRIKETLDGDLGIIDESLPRNDNEVIFITKVEDTILMMIDDRYRFIDKGNNVYLIKKRNSLSYDDKTYKDLNIRHTQKGKKIFKTA
jgi:hypothetical protein